MRRFFTVAAAAAALSVVLTAAGTAPRLVVLVVVDQMRADYVERFQGDWTSGLKRLVTEGAWYTRAAYPYLTTVTCAGHATLGTGAYPHTHGIFANTWYDRGRRAVVPCTDDTAVSAVSYGKGAAGHFGPGYLQSPTLADEMRGKGAHVVSLALKARSAIMMAGHGGDAVTWISESLDSWETSTAYAQAPVAQVKAYADANPLAADYGKVWTRRLPEAKYQDPDAGLAEDPATGWTATFPHPLTSASGAADPRYYDLWQHSPFADAYVARMAGALTASMQLGKRDGTDFLGVSFSSPDIVGHSFGPRSQEIQDMYANLDVSIGVLLDALDKAVGPGNYTLALSADHGVTNIPEQTRQSGRDGGRIDAQAAFNAGERAAVKAMGPGKYLMRITGNEVYFEPGAYDKVRANPRALRAIAAAIAKVPGIGRVFNSDEMEKGLTSKDPLTRAAALSHVKGRGGDMAISPKAGWMFSASGTTHGNASADDQRVPILLFGAGVKPGHYEQSASPADVAPTLAHLAGVPLPAAEGRVLSEALR